MNGNFELFNISRASFLRYLDLCNMQTVVVVGFKKLSLNNDVDMYRQSTNVDMYRRKVLSNTS